LKLFKGNEAGELEHASQLSSLFFGIVVTLLVDALPPMGPVAAGGVIQTVARSSYSWDWGKTISSGPANITSPRRVSWHFFRWTEYSISGKGL